VVVRVGGPGLAWADWWPVLNGVMGQPEWTNARLEIPIAGRSAELADKLIPPNEYSEADGVPETTVGKPKPLALGRLRNIEPVLIDEANFGYQFNDPAFGPVQAVDAVRVKGKTVTSGFSVNLTAGTITFSAQPSGAVTLDLRGRVSGPLGGYVEDCAGLVQDILRGLAGASAGDIDATAFAACAALRPWPLGIYLDRKISVKQAIDALLTGLLVIFRDGRDGRWSLRALEDASGAPAHVVSEDRIKLGSYRHQPDGNSPAWQVTIAGGRNWTTIANPDDSLGEADRAWLKQQFSERTASDAAVQALYPKAKELGPHQTYLFNADDAEALAGLWLALFNRERGEDGFETPLIGLPVELGDLVMVRRRRHGMAGGKLFRAWGVEEDHQRRRIKLELWG
jgi:hypothetical protein